MYALPIMRAAALRSPWRASQDPYVSVIVWGEMAARLLTNVTPSLLLVVDPELVLSVLVLDGVLSATAALGSVACSSLALLETPVGDVSLLLESPSPRLTERINPIATMAATMRKSLRLDFGAPRCCVDDAISLLR
jgi:hypothetical protein